MVDQPSNVKSNAWLFLLCMGFALISIGAFAFISPLHAYYYLVKFSGVMVLLIAVFLLLIYRSMPDAISEKRWLLIESIIDFLFALVLMANPLFSFLVFPFLIGPWIFCVGVVKSLAALSLKRQLEHFNYILYVGILSIGFGALIVKDPFATSRGITILMGTFGLILGSFDVVEALRFRRAANTVDMMI